MGGQRSRRKNSVSSTEVKRVELHISNTNPSNHRSSSIIHRLALSHQICGRAQRSELKSTKCVNLRAEILFPHYLFIKQVDVREKAGMVFCLSSSHADNHPCVLPC